MTWWLWHELSSLSVVATTEQAAVESRLPFGERFIVIGKWLNAFVLRFLPSYVFWICRWKWTENLLQVHNYTFCEQRFVARFCLLDPFDLVQAFLPLSPTGRFQFGKIDAIESMNCKGDSSDRN